jgi:hypothetical protein
MEQEGDSEVTSITPFPKDAAASGETAVKDSKEFYDSIIAEAEYAFLNASGRLPPSSGSGASAQLKRKAGTAMVKSKNATAKPSVKSSMVGHPLERVAEVLSEPISTNDHDILADEIVELVSQTLTLSTGDQGESDIFAPLRSVAVN